MARSLEDKVEAVIIFGEANRNYHAAIRIFNERFPERPMCRKYLQKLVAKFNQTGTVKDAPRSGRPKIVTEDVEIQVLAEMVNNPQQSTKQVAETSNVSITSVKRILKRNKFHPYKIKILHQLVEDDPDRRLEFCEIMAERIAANRFYLQHICFSDESTFCLNGSVNTQNCRYWCDENPHEFRAGHTQFPQKINVWAGILGDHIIGPIFLEENLNGPRYLQMLQDTITPSINEIIAQNPHEFNLDVTFQQDGAPPHYFRGVRNYLDEWYPGRWIGRRGPTEWPARSPDLTPLDYFLWGYVKSVVFKTVCGSLAELRRRIVEVCSEITPQTLHNVREEFTTRLFMCQEMQGGHVEHLLK